MTSLFKRNVLGVVTLSAAALMLAGCSHTRTIADWQRSAVTYLHQRADDDPNFLRDAAMPGGRRELAVLGAPRASEATDVKGVLVAHKRVAGRPWFIFLLGVVRDRHLKSLRLAALSDADGSPTWRLSEPDPTQLNRYLAAGDQPLPSGATPKLSYIGWPRPRDITRVAVTGQTVRVTEARSGAQWQLNLK